MVIDIQQYHHTQPIIALSAGKLVAVQGQQQSQVFHSDGLTWYCEYSPFSVALGLCLQNPHPLQG